MLGENLDAGADDESHEEKVQEVLNPQPSRETVGDNPRGRWDAGIPHEEILHRRQFPQCLSCSHANYGKHESKWQQPQYVYPITANPDLRHHADLGRQPIVQENTVVCRAEARRDGIVRRWREVSIRHTAARHADQPSTASLVSMDINSLLLLRL